MKLNRRQFIAGLVAMGATVALPVAMAKATPTQVNTAWKSLLDDPWCFTVNESATILATGMKEPATRRDVFDADLSVRCTVDSLIDDIESCYPLTTHFQDLAAAELEEVNSSLEDDDPTFMERRRLKRLAKALDDEEQGWADWIHLEGTAGLQRFKDEVDEWMASDIEYGDYEWFRRNSGAQGSAMAFFESQPFATQKALGVVIVEGDHPGSTYFAAELHSTVDEANEAAQGLGLPIRFMRESLNAAVDNAFDGSGPTTAEIERAVQFINNLHHGKASG